MGETTRPKSRELAARVIFAAFEALKENAGSLPVSKVLEEVARRVKFDDWATARYEKSGYVRWQSILHFFSIDCVKAGFLIKRDGDWHLTNEGEKALGLGAGPLLDTATAKYREWAASRGKATPELRDVAEASDAGTRETLQLEHVQAQAAEGLKDFVRTLNPYEFQDLAAALLRGMGYFTPFVAPRGKDGGVDIIAYRDPLGTVVPRVSVQVKHRDAAATAQEVRQLVGLIGKQGDVGMFISSGGFTADALMTARQSHVHVETINLDRFISLWEEFYDRLKDEDKQRMALTRVYFLAPEE